MNWINELYTIPKWKKYSQCHEECYLEHILKNIDQKNKFIVELGAGDGYTLSNTRHFIEQGYKALLIDGDSRGCVEVKQHFILRENILALLKNYKVPKAFDLFCIDLDGNDIWILDEVLSEYKPSVIIAEFNPIWGKGDCVSIKYNPEHTWGDDDFYGFSFDAGVKLAESWGYNCIFQNDNLNMYFVENGVLAKSLGIEVYSEIKKHIPQVNYEIMYGHKKSDKTDWVNYFG
jgi:hypothetical protein